LIVIIPSQREGEEIEGSNLLLLLRRRITEGIPPQILPLPLGGGGKRWGRV